MEANLGDSRLGSVYVEDEKPLSRHLPRVVLFTHLFAEF